MPHKISFTFVLLILALRVLSANYYISSQGNDSNTGLSQSAPIKTISKLNSIVLKPGDNIFFRKGDTFEGQLNIIQQGTADAPITINSYGSGNQPVISGAVKITGWRLYQGQIYVADMPTITVPINQIFVNGKTMTLARYPNTGFLKIDGGTGNTVIKSSSITQSTDYWKGANAIIRTNRWVYDNKPISTSRTGSLNLLQPASYAITGGFGFYLNNKLSELDAPGEWYHDLAGKKIYLMTPNLDNPSTLVVQGSVYDNGISMTDQNYVNINNLAFNYQRANGIEIISCDYVNISNNSFSKIYTNGISTDYRGGYKLQITGNNFRNIGSNGINVNFVKQASIRSNSFNCIALIPGMGNSGDGEYNGILAGPDNYIGFNTLDSIGYNGITCTTGNTVTNNIIKNTCMVKDDGGAIYAYKSDHIAISNNIIINALGNGTATPHPEEANARGIYMDDSSSYCTVTANTIVNSEYGIFLHNAFFCRVEKNVVYNNRISQLLIQNDWYVKENVAIKENIITENTFYSIHPEQINVSLWTYKDNIKTMGTFSKNYYCNPYTYYHFKTIFAPYYPTGTLQKVQIYTMAWWKYKQSQDIDSKLVLSTALPYYSTSNPSANLIANPLLQFSMDNWYTWGSENFSMSLDGTNPSFTTNCLKMNYSDTRINTTGNVAEGHFAVTGNSYYKLNFKAQSVKLGTLNIDISASSTPYQSLITENSFQTQPGASNYEFYFKTTQDYPAARIVFTNTVYDSTTWIDNVSLIKVNVDTNISKPLTTSPIYINSTSFPQDINLTGTYLDQTGIPICGILTLQPFSSCVLTQTNNPCSPPILSDPVLGTRDINNAEENNILVIYSLPANAGETIYMENPGFTKGKLFKLEMYDITGKELMKQTESVEEENKISFKTPDNLKGIFLIKVSNGNRILTGKIMLN